MKNLKLCRTTFYFKIIMCSRFILGLYFKATSKKWISYLYKVICVLYIICITRLFYAKEDTFKPLVFLISDYCNALQFIGNSIESLRTGEEHILKCYSTIFSLKLIWNYLPDSNNHIPISSITNFLVIIWKVFDLVYIVLMHYFYTTDIIIHLRILSILTTIGVNLSLMPIIVIFELMWRAVKALRKSLGEHLKGPVLIEGRERLKAQQILRCLNVYKDLNAALKLNSTPMKTMVRN